MREWLSGRALPCQGKCRGSESRLPLHKLSYLGKGVRHHSQVVRQRSATPSSPVRIWMVPPTICRCGGIGRRKGLKIPRWQHRIGSSPITSTRKKTILLEWSFFNEINPCGFVKILRSEILLCNVKYATRVNRFISFHILFTDKIFHNR